MYKLIINLELTADQNFLPFFALLAKTRPKPPFGIPWAFQPPKYIIFFLVILFRIDSRSIYHHMHSLIDCRKQHTMSAQLPHPSASAGTASGRAVICGKIGIATQRQRERAISLKLINPVSWPSLIHLRTAIMRLQWRLPPSNARIVCFIAVQWSRLMYLSVQVPCLPF